MIEYTTTVLRRVLSDAVNTAAFGGERIAVSRGGRVVAYLVGVDEMNALDAAEDELDARDTVAAEGGETVTFEEAMKVWGLDPHKVEQGRALLS